MLKLFFTIFGERFTDYGKKEDLDRAISALQALLRLTRDQVGCFTDEQRLDIHLCFAQASLKQYRLSRKDHDAKEEGVDYAP